MPAPGYSLRRDYLLWTLAVALVLLTLLHPAALSRYPSLVDWPTIETLAGLLLLTAGIESSGILHQVAWRLTRHIHDERSLALFLVGASALLAMVLTNDIALFIVVPLTMGLAAFAALPLRRFVIFEALAVNAGSMLTPIGNPQNIFLWQSSGVHFFSFILAMLAPTLISAACLYGFTLFAFRARSLQLQAATMTIPVRWPLFAVAAALFVPFIVCADLHHAAAALLAVAILFAAAFRPVFRRYDWPLLLVFVLMFVDLRLVAALPGVAAILMHVDLRHAPSLYAAGAMLSQFISNVPATILLAAYSPDWRTLAWGVDVGGFGLVIGSLANLIALRLSRQPGALWAFHLWATPFVLLVGSLTGVWLWLR